MNNHTSILLESLSEQEHTPPHRSISDRVLFSDSHSILKKGNINPIQPSELPPISKEIGYKSLVNSLHSILEENKGISLYSAFIKLVWSKMALFFFFAFVAEIIGIGLPFVLKEFIDDFHELVSENASFLDNGKECLNMPKHFFLDS